MVVWVASHSSFNLKQAALHELLMAPFAAMGLVLAYLVVLHPDVPPLDAVLRRSGSRPWVLLPTPDHGFLGVSKPAITLLVVTSRGGCLPAWSSPPHVPQFDFSAMLDRTDTTPMVEPSPSIHICSLSSHDAPRPTVQVDKDYNMQYPRMLLFSTAASTAAGVTGFAHQFGGPLSLATSPQEQEESG